MFGTDEVGIRKNAQHIFSKEAKVVRIAIGIPVTQPHRLEVKIHNLKERMYKKSLLLLYILIQLTTMVETPTTPLTALAGVSTSQRQFGMHPNRTANYPEDNCRKVGAVGV